MGKKIGIGAAIICVIVLGLLIYWMNFHQLPFGLFKSEPPAIVLAGGDVTIKLGDEYFEPGYSATDADGKDISEQVKISDTKFTRAGEQNVTYTVEADNQTTTASRKVNVEPNTGYSTPGLPICMYHYVYDKNNPPDDLSSKGSNYIEVSDLEGELNWLKEQGYYFPDWSEVRDYIDGKLLLPEKSIVITFDDAAYSFLENGIPVLEKCRVKATSFVITSHEGESKVAGYASEYVDFESHSDNMHRPGGNIGHGGVLTAISKEDGLADLKKSIEICGNGNAFAYPFGDYNDSGVELVKEAGFKCAVTTEYGKAKPGMNPLLLPRMRMSKGQSIDAFASMVRPS